MARTKAEEVFIDQRTRQLLVKWADHCVRNPEGIPDLNELQGIHYTQRLATARALEMHREYYDYAIAKGWLGKKVTEGHRRLTSQGWSTAATFLRR